jgi:hypothetical protein
MTLPANIILPAKPANIPGEQAVQLKKPEAMIFINMVL